MTDPMAMMMMSNLGQHMSLLAQPAAKAHVRAVHHETGETLEEGWYDAYLIAGQAVCIDRDVYAVQSIDHPNRSLTGVADSDDLQIARLAPA